MFSPLRAYRSWKIKRLEKRENFRFKQNFGTIQIPVNYDPNVPPNTVYLLNQNDIYYDGEAND